MRISTRILAIGLVFSMPLTALADDADFGLAARASTLGLGIEFSKSIPLTGVSARLGYNWFSYDLSQGYAGIDYDTTIDMESVALAIDWRPVPGPFHLTAGVLYNLNEVQALNEPAPTYDIGGTTYTAAEVGNLTAVATFEDFAPFAGIGWTIPLAPTLAMSFDLGVLYQRLDAITIVSDGTLAGDPAFQGSLMLEVDDFADDIEDYEYYPVISLGFRKKF